VIEDAEDLRRWFRDSGVRQLDACIGPLPQSRAALGRWRSDGADHVIRAVSPHPGSYRLALMLEPLEARIWNGEAPIWGGMIAANRFRLCPPGESGQWSLLSGCDIVNLFIPVSLVDQYAERRGDLDDASLSVDTFLPDRLVQDTVLRMLDAQAIAGPLAQQACDGLISMLVCYLLEHYSRPVARPDASSLGGARLRRVLRHVGGNLETPPCNKELAALCGMSESHFTREFHRAVGLPPHRYILKLRLERASAALRESDARIIDIAHDCGFSSASHFSRAFSAQFGIAPAQFRQQQQGAAVLGK
jgi:AraC family transcriptional regulator